MWNTELMTDTMMENKSAHQNDATAKPGTTAAASMMSNALMTNKKRPNVMKVNGNVNSTTSGRMNALIAPRTTASTSAAIQPVTVTPGNRYAAIMIATADTNQFSMSFIRVVKGYGVSIRYRQTMAPCGVHTSSATARGVSAIFVNDVGTVAEVT